MSTLDMLELHGGAGSFPPSPLGRASRAFGHTCLERLLGPPSGAACLRPGWAFLVWLDLPPQRSPLPSVLAARLPFPQPVSAVWPTQRTQGPLHYLPLHCPTWKALAPQDMATFPAGRADPAKLLLSDFHAPFLPSWSANPPAAQAWSRPIRMLKQEARRSLFHDLLPRWLLQPRASSSRLLMSGGGKPPAGKATEFHIVNRDAQ